MTNYASHDHGFVGQPDSSEPSSLVELLARRRALLEDVRLNEEGGQFWGRAGETDKAMQHFNWASQSRHEAADLLEEINKLSEAKALEVLS